MGRAAEELELPERQKHPCAPGAVCAGISEGSDEASEGEDIESSCSDGPEEEERGGDADASDEGSDYEELVQAILEYVEFMSKAQGAESAPLPSELKERVRMLLAKGGPWRIHALMFPCWQQSVRCCAARCVKTPCPGTS